MDKGKPIGSLSGRLFVFSAVLIAGCHLSVYLARELWFDEVLTLLNFASLEDPLRIYLSYFIPNNQIVSTIFFHWLIGLGVPPEFLRLFPLLCGILTVWLLWRDFAGELGRMPLALGLGAWALSPPFLLYATALRGYMLASLFVAAGLCAARRYALGGKMRRLFGWFIFSALAVGVMPSALAGVAAAGLYAAPCCGKKCWRSPKIYLLALCPAAGFLLFYLPIWKLLLKAFELKEGWKSGPAGLLAVSVAATVTFLPLLPGVLRHRPRLRQWPRTLIWLLPLGGLLLPVYPFPRVWFPLFPVFALLMAGYLRRVSAFHLKIIGAAVLLWGAAAPLESARRFLSPLCSLSGQDDFYAPRFTLREFRPSETAGSIRDDFPEDRTVFVSFDADPWAVIYYYGGKVEFDGPRGPAAAPPSRSAVVLSSDESPETFEKRFRGRLLELKRIGCHRVYLLVR